MTAMSIRLGLLWGRARCRRMRGASYISASFRVSIIAAMGMPKLEAGPQKSVCEVY